MFFLDISPAPTAEAPVLMAQADYGVGRNVVVQDLTPRPVLMAQADYGVGRNVVVQDLTPHTHKPLQMGHNRISVLTREN